MCFKNASILIIASANFHTKGDEIAEISDAYTLLENYLGKFFAILFAFGLLCSGQSSTITGTLAGQYIMSGFLGKRFKVPVWARRLVTRLVAILPALVIGIIMGDSGLNRLLILSQVILSIQLPFAIWPLLHFTSRKDIMSVSVKETSIEELPLHSLEKGSEASSISLDPTVKMESDGLTNSIGMMIIIFLVNLCITGFNVVLIVQTATK